MAEEQDKIDIGHALVDVVVLDQISVDHVFENMVHAATYSVRVGEDQIPGIEADIVEYLCAEDIVI